jgi:hypothetical protein
VDEWRSPDHPPISVSPPPPPPLPPTPAIAAGEEGFRSWFRRRGSGAVGFLRGGEGEAVERSGEMVAGLGSRASSPPSSLSLTQ